MERLGAGAPLVELDNASSKRGNSIIRAEYVLPEESVLAGSD